MQNSDLSIAADDARERIRLAGDLAYSWAELNDNAERAEIALRIAQANQYHRELDQIQKELAQKRPYEFGDLYIPIIN